MNIKLITMMGLLVVMFSNCSKPDSDLSLITPSENKPAFKRCHLSKEYINGKLYREVVYKPESNYEIEKILYYNNDGDNLVNLNETYTYENGNVVEIKSNLSLQTYKYNEKNDVVEDRYCADNSCTSFNYTYDYIAHTRPVSFTRQKDNNVPVTVYLEYQNSNLMSYFAYTLSNNGQVIFPEFTNQKFQSSSYVFPYYEIQPNPFNLYQSRLHENYVNNTIIHYDILDARGYFPLGVEVTTYKLPNFEVQQSNTYTYEYTGCD